MSLPTHSVTTIAPFLGAGGGVSLPKRTEYSGALKCLQSVSRVQMNRAKHLWYTFFLTSGQASANMGLGTFCYL